MATFRYFSAGGPAIRLPRLQSGESVTPSAPSSRAKVPLLHPGGAVARRRCRSRGKGIGGSWPVVRIALQDCDRRGASWLRGTALLGLGELSSAMSGVADCRSARCGVRAASDGFADAGRHDREQAPTASSGTAACPGVATLLLTTRSRCSGCLLASTSGAPGGCSGVALAMRPMLVARSTTLRPQR